MTDLMANGPDKPRLLISSQSAPASYMKTAKRHLRDSGGLVLCGLGDALANVVTLAELLKTQDLAQIDLILTGLQSVDGQARPRSRAQLEIVLSKSSQCDAILAAERERQEAASAARKQEAAGGSSQVADGPAHNPGTLDSSESSGQSGTLQTDSGQSSTGLGSSLGSLTISGSGPNDSRPSSSGRGRGSRGGRPQSSPPPGSLQ